MFGLEWIYRSGISGSGVRIRLDLVFEVGWILHYVSLFVDLGKKRTIFVAEGKGSETMAAFTEDFKEHLGNPHEITDVSIDMSPAFIKGVEENLPNAAITFYKYHSMKIINTAVDDVRKAEVKEQSLLRGQKYIFLKNRQNLTESQHKFLKAIEAMPRLNLKTLRAYHIRENFQEIYKEETREGFERALKRWYFWATHSCIDPIRDAAKTIRRIGPEYCAGTIVRSTMASWRDSTAWFRLPKQRLGVTEPSRTLRPSFTCLQESWTTLRLAYPLEMRRNHLLLTVKRNRGGVAEILTFDNGSRWDRSAK